MIFRNVNPNFHDIVISEGRGMGISGIIERA